MANKIKDDMEERRYKRSRNNLNIQIRKLDRLIKRGRIKVRIWGLMLVVFSALMAIWIGGAVLWFLFGVNTMSAFNGWWLTR